MTATPTPEQLRQTLRLSRVEYSLALLRCLNRARASHNRYSADMYERALADHDAAAGYVRPFYPPDKPCSE